jgi:adenylate cyclase
VAIQSDLAGQAADFRLGIGIASGAAVAGQIGTADQAKVTVFGPVVNLAARLETLTRQLGADILLDETTATTIASEEKLEMQVRRLAIVVPKGLDKPVTVSRLVPPGLLSGPLSAAALDEYDRTLEDFNSGRWDDARPKLEALAQYDAAAAFLLQQMNLHDRRPPHNFQGIIRLQTK